MDTKSLNILEENKILRQNVAELQKQLQESYSKIMFYQDKVGKLEKELQGFQK